MQLTDYSYCLLTGLPASAFALAALQWCGSQSEALKTSQISSLLFSELSQTSHLSQSALTVHSTFSLAGKWRPHHALQAPVTLLVATLQPAVPSAHTVPCHAGLCHSQLRPARFQLTCPERLFLWVLQSLFPHFLLGLANLSQSDHWQALFVYPQPCSWV